MAKRAALRLPRKVTLAGEVSVRPWRPADRAALLAGITNLQELERALSDTRLPGSKIAVPYLAMLRRRASRAGGMFLVAECDGDFVGFAAGWIEQGDTIAQTKESGVFGYVSDVYVVPARRGLGIAQILLAAAEQHFAALGMKRMRVFSLAGNVAAHAAYRRAGFAHWETVFDKSISRAKPKRGG